MKKAILLSIPASSMLAAAALAQAQDSGLTWLIFTDFLGVGIGIVALAYSYKNQQKYRGGIIGKSHGFINIALTFFMLSFILHILDYKGVLPESAITMIIPSLVAPIGILFIAMAAKVYRKDLKK